MILRTLGTGNAFAKKNWQSNFLITNNGKHLLIDCGTYCWLAAEEVGITTADIDAVFISHIHADHVGGLEELAFTTVFNPALKRPAMFCEGTYERIDGDDSGRYTSGLVKQLWDDRL